MVNRTALKAQIGAVGYARLPGRAAIDFFECHDAEAWRQFVGSWDDLGADLYMADGGRYRRRRHAAFRVVDGVAERKPHQPHFQSRDYNRLNGDVQRWFMPVSEAVASSPVTRAILRQCGLLFTAVSGRPADQPWHVELHQFRIEASAETEGRPTPEGRHRDGVDWVLVMLIARDNVSEGLTEISTPGGEALGRFTLDVFGDAVFLDDHRVLHGVTPITPIDPAALAHRDALVVTFLAQRVDAPAGWLVGF